MSYVLPLPATGVNPYQINFDIMINKPDRSKVIIIFSCKLNNIYDHNTVPLQIIGEPESIIITKITKVTASSFEFRIPALIADILYKRHSVTIRVSMLCKLKAADFTAVCYYSSAKNTKMKHSIVNTSESFVTISSNAAVARSFSLLHYMHNLNYTLQASITCMLSPDDIYNKWVQYCNKYIILRRLIYGMLANNVVNNIFEASGLIDYEKIQNTITQHAVNTFVQQRDISIEMISEFFPQAELLRRKHKLSGI